MNAELTTVKKILVAASQLDQEKETFTAEDLIVRAWQQYPESFGLNGYRESHPDSNRVLSKLMGSVGLCSRGWLEQVSTKTYRMTPAGRKLVLGLKSDAGAPAATNGARVVTRVTAKPEASETRTRKEEVAPSKARAKEERHEAPVAKTVAAKPASPPAMAAKSASVVVPVAKPAPVAAPVAKPVVEKPAPAPVAAKPAPAPVAVAEKPAPAPKSAPASSSGEAFDGLTALSRLANSVASQKFTRGGLVTFADACQFWAITPAVHANHLSARLDEIQHVLARAEGHIQSTGQVLRVNDKLELTLTTVIGLQGLHRMLTQKYHRELDAIRARSGAEDEA